MPWIAVNRISVEEPSEADRLVEAFRRRSGKVDEQPGFLGFELWREEAGRDVMVLTRWRHREDIEAWIESPAFREAHRHAEGAPGRGAGTIYEQVL
jgi:heme-degrading monooxygenase HmoA